MDNRQPKTIFAVLQESFKLVKRSWLSLLGLMLLGALVGCLHFVAGFLGCASIILLPFILLIAAMCGITLWQLFADRAQDQNTSLFALINKSMMPAIYLAISGFLLTLSFIIIAIGVFYFTRTLDTMGQVCLWIPTCVGFLYLLIRFSFMPLSIALRDQGPLSALSDSWEFTRGRFWYVVAMWAIYIVIPSLVSSVPAVLVGPVSVWLTLFQMNQSIPSWVKITVLGICALVMLVFSLFMVWLQFSMSAFYVLMFLQMDYCDVGCDEKDVPDLLPAQATDFAPDKTIAPVGTGAISTEILHKHEVQVVRASVKSQENAEIVAKHLNEVYNPSQNATLQQAEEDRMPTVLFDDEMAKQMEADRARWAAEQARSHKRLDDSNNDSPIKMSK